jgi:hypothetical protein
MQASISSGCRNDTAVQGGWDTHSSALGLQTQQCLLESGDLRKENCSGKEYTSGRFELVELEAFGRWLEGEDVAKLREAHGAVPQ